MARLRNVVGLTTGIKLRGVQSATSSPLRSPLPWAKPTRQRYTTSLPQTRQLQCPSWAAVQFRWPPALPRCHDRLRLDGALLARPSARCAAGPARQGLRMCLRHSAAPMRRDDSGQHHHRADLGCRDRAGARHGRGCGRNCQCTWPGATPSVSRHGAGSSIGRTLASSTTTEEPRPWLGTRSEPRAQSRWPECTPRSRATTSVARLETTVRF